MIKFDNKKYIKEEIENKSRDTKAKKIRFSLEEWGNKKKINCLRMEMVAAEKTSYEFKKFILTG